MKKKIVVLLIILTGCGGAPYQKRQRAQSHFSQASLEIKEFQEKNDTKALRHALNEVDQSLDIYPTPHARGLKATILLQLGKVQESKELFEVLLADKHLPKVKRADALNNYAIALYQLGDSVGAERVWHELIGNAHYISPEVACFNLGYSQLNNALKYVPNNGHMPVAAHEHLTRAVMYFKQALAISKEYIDALFYLGQALIALQWLHEARDCYMTILTINPNHGPAQRILKYVEAQLSTQPEAAPQLNAQYRHTTAAQAYVDEQGL